MANFPCIVHLSRRFSQRCQPEIVLKKWRGRPDSNLRPLQRRCRIALRNLQRYFPHLFVNGAVGGENHRPAQAVRLTREIADFTTSLFDEERTRRGVPFLQAEFPEAVEAAGGHRSEIEGSGTVASDAMGAQRKIPVVVNVGIRQAFVYRKTSAQQTG